MDGSVRQASGRVKRCDDDLADVLSEGEDKKTCINQLGREVQGRRGGECVASVSTNHGRKIRKILGGNFSV